MDRRATGPAMPALGSRCFRITAQGRACIDREEQTSAALPRHLHDVLLMCRADVWFGQLRQFMPPKSLESVLRCLLDLELIEIVQMPLPVRVLEVPARSHQPDKPPSPPKPASGWVPFSSWRASLWGK